MTGTSQQIEDWGRPAAPSRRDVGAALAALSEEDLLRLRATAFAPNVARLVCLFSVGLP